MAIKNSRANVTIDVRIRTRQEMNTGTPRIGNWTYHHIQPVRIYYLAASTILRFITDPDCYDETRHLGVMALCQMVNNPHNATNVRAFVNQFRGVVTSDDERSQIAKLCASPPFGGFAGVNPAQRSDDPRDAAEPNRPLSAPSSWWLAIMQIGAEAMAAFGQTQMPAPNTNLTATKMVHEWNEIILSMIQDISHASACGPAAFDRRDWMLTDGTEVWTVVTGTPRPPWPARNVQPVPQYPSMALRQRGERYSYLDQNDVPVGSMVRRGVNPLRVRQGSDFIDYF